MLGRTRFICGSRVAAKRKRARERFEERLHLMVRRTPIEQPQMHVGRRRLRESAEEILDQLGLQAADLARREIAIGKRSARAR